MNLDGVHVMCVVAGLIGILIFGHQIWMMTASGMFGPPTKLMSRADHPKLFLASIFLNVVLLALFVWLLFSQLLGWSAR
jgi:hypothetical protein